MLSCSIDLSRFKQQAARSIEAIHFGVRDAARNAAEEGAQEAKDVGSFQDQTGNLRGHIAANPVSSNVSSAKWEICSPMPYSIFVERGTRPHEIWPKAGYNLKGPVRNGQTRRAMGKGPHEHIVGRGKMLRWVSGGQSFFAAHVNHPGTHGYFFMRAGATKAEEVLYRELEAIADKLRLIWQV